MMNLLWEVVGEKISGWFADKSNVSQRKRLVSGAAISRTSFRSSIRTEAHFLFDIGVKTR